MERYIYISSVAAGMCIDQMAQIATTAQRNNARAGLTGILIWVGDAFIQVLEGPTRALDETLGRIRMDKRHRRMTKMCRKPIEERLFRGWAMGACVVGRGELPPVILPRPDSQSVFETLLGAPDAELSTFLSSFYDLNSAQGQMRVA